MPPVTQLKGTQIADGTIKSEDIDDSLEFDLTKVRATSEDSSPNFLSSKIVAGTNIAVSVIGSSGSDQTLRISSTASGEGGGTPAGVAGGDLGGSYPSPTVTQARGLLETSGPTTLTLGAVADGQVLRRSGSTVVGAWIALALVVSQADAAVNLEALAVVYLPVTSFGGTVV